MRRLLEASWNVDTMGGVPTNVDNAADGAVEALNNAVERTKESLFYVDLLLPQYDIRQGSNLYDEVMAVEFCIALSNRMAGKTAIVVRDSKSVDTVSRILNARQRDLGRQRQEEETGNSADSSSGEDKVVYDDFADFGLVGDGDDDDDDEADSDSAVPSLSTSSVESFRDQLIAGWDNDDGVDDDDKVAKGVPPANAAAPAAPSPKAVEKYRLTSMLGSEKISSGADMTDDVVRAVKANAEPREDDDTIIILSAASKEEMIGVRGLVAKYEGKKKILLVNCNLNPPPRELMMAQTVYSIQPFIARPKVSEANLFGNQATPKQQDQPSPKVVVMRRYPRDWEVFVDLGSGFELAQSVPPSQVDKKGPNMQFVASCVKRHMQSRLG